MAILSSLKRMALRLKGGHFSPRRPVLFALEVVAGLAFSLLIAFGLLLWRLSEGPVSLAFLHDRIERTINAELSNARAEFTRPVMLKEKDGGIRLRLLDIKVRDAEGQILAAAPMAAVSASPWGILSGKTAITRMILIRPTITLSHGSDGQFSFGIADSMIDPPFAGKKAAPAPKAPSPSVKAAPHRDRKALWSALFTEEQFNLLEKLNINPQSNLSYIGVKDASLIVIDETSGTIVRAGNTNLALNRTKAGYTLTASTRFRIKNEYSSLSFIASFEHGGAANIVTRFKDLKPAEFSHLIANPAMSGANLPLSGKASFTLDAKGILLRASADIEAGAGLLEYGGVMDVPVLVDEADVTLFFDARTDSIAIEQGAVVSGNNRIDYSGKIELVRDAERNIKTYDLALSSSKLALALDSETEEPVRFSWATLKAKISPAPFFIEIEKARIGTKKLQLELAGHIREAPLSPEIQLRGSGKFIPVDAIKRLWPTSLAPGTREWIGNNVEAGYIKDARFEISLAPGEIARARTGTPIPDDHIQLSFNAQKARFTFLKGLPPIQNASAHGLLTGDRLDIRLTKGLVRAPSGGRVKITGGRFTIPKIHEDVTLGKTNGYVSASLAGKTKAVLEIIDMKPLEYVSMMNIRPRSVGGTSTGRLELAIPLQRDLTLEQISVRIKADLKGTKIPQIYQGVDLSDGDLLLSVNNKGLEAKGKIALNGVPFALKWNERFITSSKLTTRFELAATLDGKARKALGIDLAHVLRGPAAIRLVADARRGKIARARVEADLKHAELRQDDIKWKKPSGVPATAAFALEFSEKGMVRLRKLVLKGKHLKVTGAIRFDEEGRIRKLDLGQVILGRETRFALSGRRDKNGVLHLKAKGKQFDARPLLKELMTAPPSPDISDKDAEAATRMTLEAGFDRVLLFNNVTLGKTSVVLGSAGDLVEKLLVKGEFASKRSVLVKISRVDKTTRRLRIASKDGGALLRGADYYMRVRGGNFDLDARMKNPGGAMNGKVRLEKFTIVGEPALKSILSSSNVKAKKGDIQDTEKVFFDKLRLTFKRIPGVLTIEKALIAGPSIGATAKGRINHVNQTLQMAGTLVPVYGLNAVFGKIPVLGRFLSGRKGEGLIGITFGIQGPMKHPILTLNPASALAPGFLRMLFEFNSGVKTTPTRPPKPLNDK